MSNEMNTFTKDHYFYPERAVMLLPRSCQTGPIE